MVLKLEMVLNKCVQNFANFIFLKRPTFSVFIIVVKPAKPAQNDFP